MIGWTKQRKRCPTHGLVLRGRPDSHKADYCPACGQKLVQISIPYLFQIYFHPAIMIVPGILVFFFGLFFFLDVRGCIIEDRQVRAVIDKQNEIEYRATRKEQRKEKERFLLTMPTQWKTLYAGMDSIYYRDDKWKVFQAYFQHNPKLPKLSPEQLKLFIAMLKTGKQCDAFSLITTHSQFAPDHWGRYRPDFQEKVAP